MATDSEQPSITSPSSPRQAQWRSVVIVGFVLMLTQLGYYLTTAALPLYLRDLGTAQNRIGFEVGLGNMTAVVVTLLLGPALNRYGPRVFLSVGGVIYLVTALGMLAVAQVGTVAALRAAQGIGTAVILPSAFTLGAKLMPDRQATSLGVLGAVSNIALALGPPLGLALYTSHGAAWLFVPAAAAASLGFLSTLFLPRQEGSLTRASGFGFDRAWLPALFTNLLGVTNWGAIVAYLPIYLQHQHGPNAGILFTADAVGVLLLRIPTGILADRYGSLVPKLVGLAISLPAIAILALPPSILTLALAGAGTGGGAGLFITGIMGDLSRLSTDANRGTAMSLSGASFSAGIFLGSAIAGLLIGPGGFDAIVLFGCVTCAAAVPFAISRR
jgi:MFS family permease